MNAVACPNWCDLRDSASHQKNRGGDHWRYGTYVAASESEPIDVDSNGAEFPAVAVHLARGEGGGHGDRFALHVSAIAGRGSDIELAMRAEEVVAFAANLLEQIAAHGSSLTGGWLSGRSEDVLAIEKYAGEIVSARERVSA